MEDKNLKGNFIIEDYKTKAKFRNKKLFKYLMEFKSLFFISLLLTVLASTIQLLKPLILGKILDSELLEGIGAKDLSHFYKLLIIYFAVTILAAIIVYIRYISFFKLSDGITKKIRKDTFAHVLSLPVQFFDKYAIGKIANRITNDTADIRNLFRLLFTQILVIAVKTIVLVVTLFIMNWILGIITLIAMPIMYIIFKDFFSKSTKNYRKLKKYRSDLNGNLAENIHNIEIVQAFNREDDIYEEFSEINDNIDNIGWDLSHLWAYSSSNLTDTLSKVIISLVIFLCGIYFLNGRELISIGLLYVFVEYNTQLYDNITSLMDQIGQLESAKSAADQLFELQRVEKFEEGQKDIENMQGDLSFENVSFAYNENDYVIKNISFNVPKGSSAAFVGHTGSGKSTIMNLIYKFYKINKGTISIDGININELNMEKIRTKMAIVFQNPYIFEGTIYENISLFDSKITKNEAELALISVGGERLLEKNGGIDAKVGESGSGFSAGEKQIISFARALVRDPKILVLDEATSNVDTETEALIQFGLNKLKKGRTTLIIAHRLSTIKDCDKIYLLEKGNLIESGTHEDLMKLKGRYYKMYEN